MILKDHIGGFSQDYSNAYLDYALENFVGKKILTEYLFDDRLKEKYKFLDLIFSLDLWKKNNFVNDFRNYKTHPEVNFQNFVCSFNGSNHVSRQLLSLILSNQKYFDPRYSSKNFVYNNDWIYGHLFNLDLNDQEIKFYSKFFVSDNEFNNSVYSFGHVQYDHGKNIYNLEHKLTQSFLHIVSETVATSYYPFVTEKFLYSIVTRGLFLAYAQPNWHKHIEKYYGFRLYNRIFDYDFDSVQHPVKRLIRLIEIISKFSTLSVDDWRDLYLLEQDTIEYNYDHYHSGNYLKYLANYE